MHFPASGIALRSANREFSKKRSVPVERVLMRAGE